MISKVMESEISYKNMSLIEMFSEQNPEFQMLLSQLDLIRKKFEIIEDFHCQTIVEDSLLKE